MIIQMLILILLFLLLKTQLYLPVVTLLAKYNQQLWKPLRKGFTDWFIKTNIKQKVRIKIRQINIDIFWNQVLLELIDYLF